MGQCNKIISFKEPFFKFKMSTKNLFDHMYIFMQEINANCHKNQGLDPMNGMPIASYEEVSSQHWNLMYKQTGADKELKKFLNIDDLGSFKDLGAFDMDFIPKNFSTISSFRAGSTIVKSKAAFGTKKNSVFDAKRQSNQSVDPSEKTKKKRYKDKLEFRNTF